MRRTLASALRRRSTRAAVSLVVVLVLTASACSSSDSVPPAVSAHSSAYSSQASVSLARTPLVTDCVPPALATMSLRDKLAQMLLVGVTGAADARSVVANSHVGGIFVGSWTDFSMLTDGSLKAIENSATLPLMVTVDQEGGRVARLRTLGIDSPSARELSQTQTPEQVRALAYNTGTQLKRLGITVDFAPDLDVSDEPDDEVIGDRSFSNDPAVVTRYALAFSHGLRDAGIMPVYKHFPGHGHGSGDSHTGSVTTPPLSQLATSDLVPYRTVLSNPVLNTTTGVMVGHLIVPGLTAVPASISPAGMTMLRTGQGYAGSPFDGLIFTDDLSGMAAINANYGIADAVTRALSAGADLALWITTTQVPAVLDALTSAVGSGQLTLARVDASVARILRAKGAARC